MKDININMVYTIINTITTVISVTILFFNYRIDKRSIDMKSKPYLIIENIKFTPNKKGKKKKIKYIHQRYYYGYSNIYNLRINLCMRLKKLDNSIVQEFIHMKSSIYTQQNNENYEIILNLIDSDYNERSAINHIVYDQFTDVITIRNCGQAIVAMRIVSAEIIDNQGKKLKINGTNRYLVKKLETNESLAIGFSIVTNDFSNTICTVNKEEYHNISYGTDLSSIPINQFNLLYTKMILEIEIKTPEAWYVQKLIIKKNDMFNKMEYLALSPKKSSTKIKE
jgi:hypothetical protein